MDNATNMPNNNIPMNANTESAVEQGPEVQVEEGNTKKAKISKAQQYMFFAVLGASLVAGVAGVVAIYLVRYINFNIRVISAKEEAISAYEDAYANAKKLRSAVLDEMTANKDLESVARDSVAICKKSDGDTYTYSELQEKYDGAEEDEKREYYLGLIKMCSSLRVIPDALPSVGNETALMSSLSQIFKWSNWEWESLTPSNSSMASNIEGVNAISLSLAVEGDSGVTRRVLSNIEKSVRNFTINSANIVWTENNLTLNAQATAYYADGQTLEEKTVTVNPEEKKK